MPRAGRDPAHSFSGSQSVMSASAPTLIAPLRGQRPSAREAFSADSVTNWEGVRPWLLTASFHSTGVRPWMPAAPGGVRRWSSG